MLIFSRELSWRICGSPNVKLNRLDTKIKGPCQLGTFKREIFFIVFSVDRRK